MFGDIPGEVSAAFKTPHGNSLQQILSFFVTNTFRIYCEGADHPELKAKKNKFWMCKHLLCVFNPDKSSFGGLL